MGRKKHVDVARIKTLAEEGKSLREIARELGTTPSAISYWVTKLSPGGRGRAFKELSLELGIPTQKLQGWAIKVLAKEPVLLRNLIDEYLK